MAILASQSTMEALLIYKFLTVLGAETEWQKTTYKPKNGSNKANFALSEHYISDNK